MAFCGRLKLIKIKLSVNKALDKKIANALEDTTNEILDNAVKIAVEEGQKVEVGELIVVLEAMKMEQPLVAHRVGVISNLSAVIGETVSSGSTLCDIIDA